MEIRKDPWNRHWVLISSERAKRPSDFDSATSSPSFCPFCPGNESQTPSEIYALRKSDSPSDSPGWQTRVVPNKYPALALLDISQHSMDKKVLFSSLSSSNLEESMEGKGIHWVVVETSHHCLPYEEMDLEEIQNIFSTFQICFSRLWENIETRAPLLFKNHGSLAGASLSHPHSQVVGLPLVPPLLQEKWMAFQNHYREKKICLLCSIVTKEQEGKKRLICQNDSFMAVIPYAARSPFEILLFPTQHGSHFHQITGKELEDLSSIWKEIFQRLRLCLGKFDYNYLIHTSPKEDVSSLSSPVFQEKFFHPFHWHLEILPRLAYLAGFEWGTGCYINSLLPEEGARKLREIM